MSAQGFPVEAGAGGARDLLLYAELEVRCEERVRSPGAAEVRAIDSGACAGKWWSNGC